MRYSWEIFSESLIQKFGATEEEVLESPGDIELSVVTGDLDEATSEKYFQEVSKNASHDIRVSAMEIERNLNYQIEECFEICSELQFYILNCNIKHFCEIKRQRSLLEGAIEVDGEHFSLWIGILYDDDESLVVTVSITKLFGCDKFESEFQSFVPIPLKYYSSIGNQGAKLEISFKDFMCTHLFLHRGIKFAAPWEKPTTLAIIIAKKGCCGVDANYKTEVDFHDKTYSGFGDQFFRLLYEHSSNRFWCFIVEVAGDNELEGLLGKRSVMSRSRKLHNHGTKL